MEAEAERALQAAEAIGAPLLAGYALNASARTAMWQGRFDEAEATCDRLVVLARQENDADHLAWVLAVKVILLALGGGVGGGGPFLGGGKTSPPVRPRSHPLAWGGGVHPFAGDI